MSMLLVVDVRVAKALALARKEEVGCLLVAGCSPLSYTALEKGCRDGVGHE